MDAVLESMEGSHLLAPGRVWGPTRSASPAVRANSSVAAFLQEIIKTGAKEPGHASNGYRLGGTPTRIRWRVALMAFDRQQGLILLARCPLRRPPQR
jgi:hypothetical protein